MADINEILYRERCRTRGPYYDPVAMPFHRIVIGDSNRLNEEFVRTFRITHIINCAGPELDKKIVKPQNYECIDAVDSLSVNILDWYPKFKEALDRFLRDPTCLNVYVHCQAGMNRSVALTVAYIVRVFRVPLEKCVEKIVRQRPCVLTNSAFVEQLKKIV